MIEKNNRRVELIRKKDKTEEEDQELAELQAWIADQLEPLPWEVFSEMERYIMEHENK